MLVYFTTNSQDGRQSQREYATFFDEGGLHINSPTFYHFDEFDFNENQLDRDLVYTYGFLPYGYYNEGGATSDGFSTQYYTNDGDTGLPYEGVGSFFGSTTFAAQSVYEGELDLSGNGDLETVYTEFRYMEGHGAATADFHETLWCEYTHNQDSNSSSYQKGDETHIVSDNTPLTHKFTEVIEGSYTADGQAWFSAHVCGPNGHGGQDEIDIVSSQVNWDFHSYRSSISQNQAFELKTTTTTSNSFNCEFSSEINSSSTSWGRDESVSSTVYYWQYTVEARGDYYYEFNGGVSYHIEHNTFYPSDPFDTVYSSSGASVYSIIDYSATFSDFNADGYINFFTVTTEISTHISVISTRSTTSTFYLTGYNKTNIFTTSYTKSHTISISRYSCDVPSYTLTKDFNSPIGIHAGGFDTCFDFKNGTTKDNEVVWIVDGGDGQEGILTDIAYSSDQNFTLEGGDFSVLTMYPRNTDTSDFSQSVYDIHWTQTITVTTSSSANFANQFVIPNKTATNSTYTFITTTTTHYGFGDFEYITPYTRESRNYTTTATTVSILIDLSSQSPLYLSNYETAIPIFPAGNPIRLGTTSAYPLTGITTTSIKSNIAAFGSESYYTVITDTGLVAFGTHYGSIATTIYSAERPTISFSMATYEKSGGYYLPKYAGGLFPFNFKTNHYLNSSVYCALSASIVGDLSQYATATTNLASLFAACEVADVVGQRPIYSIMFTGNKLLNLSFTLKTNVSTTLDLLTIKAASSTTTNIGGSTVKSLIYGDIILNLYNQSQLSNIAGLTRYFPWQGFGSTFTFISSSFTTVAATNTVYDYYGGNPGNTDSITRWHLADSLVRYITSNWGGETSFSYSTIGVNDSSEAIGHDVIVAEFVGKYPYIALYSTIPVNYYPVPSFLQIDANYAVENKYFTAYNSSNGEPLNYNLLTYGTRLYNFDPPIGIFISTA